VNNTELQLLPGWRALLSYQSIYGDYFVVHHLRVASCPTQLLDQAAT